MIIISIVLNDDQGGHMAELTDSLWWFEPAGVFRAGLTPSHPPGCPHKTLSVAKQSNHPHLSLILRLSDYLEYPGTRVSS